MPHSRFVVLALGWAAVAVVLLLTIVGEDIRGFFVGAAEWKNWAVDRPLSLVFLVVVALAVAAARRLGRAWIALAEDDPGNDDHRRRLVIATFGFAILAPMIVINARSLGRLVVFDHPRKDLGWKKEMIEVAAWLSDHRILVLITLAAVMELIRRRGSLAAAAQ